MRKLLTLIIFVLFILTGYIIYLIQQRQDELQDLTRYTDSWSVSQVITEYFRLEASLQLFAVSPEDITSDDVHLRIDIMISQSQLFFEGEFGVFIRKNPEYAAIAKQLNDILENLNLNIENLSHSQILDILSTMRGLEAPLRKIASESLVKDIKIVNQKHDKIKNLYYIYSIVSLILVVFSFILWFLVYSQKNKLMKAHVRMESLTFELQKKRLDLIDKNKKLRFVAYNDSLTLLANRLSFWQMLPKLNGFKNDINIKQTIILFDLDRFKEVNDSLGHDAGDELLRLVGKRLRRFVGDGIFIYRLGGDEFALLSTQKSRDDLIVLVNKIKVELCKAYNILDHVVNIGVSIGIAYINKDNHEDVYKNADLALYEAKKSGGDNIIFFESWMLDHHQDIKSLQADLLKALENNEFSLVYQPISYVSNRQIYGYEALIRWYHPTRGLVSPEIFISVAEKMGIIDKIGIWVIENACSDYAKWKGKFKLSVNVSPLQLLNCALPNILSDAMKKYHIDPSCIDLEITESSFSELDVTSLSVLTSLRNQGVNISLDDFGTGYSSLSRLSAFKFNTIKIDRSFIENITSNVDGLKLFKAIINLGKSLDTLIVAEGVETEEQMAYLHYLGCDLVQGYLLGKPGNYLNT